jgi:tetratricopeptide (TPR) repeat protein
MSERARRQRLLPILYRAGIVERVLMMELPLDAPLPRALEDAGIVDEGRLADELADRMGVPRGSPDELGPVDDAISRSLPRELCLRHEVFPLSLEDKLLTLAMWDPTDLAAVDDVQFATGWRVGRRVFTWTEVQRALGRHLAERAAPATTLDEPTVDLEEAARDSPVVKLTNLIFVDAIKKDAHFRIVYDDRGGVIEHQTRGTDAWQEVMRPPPRMIPPLLRRISVMCGAPGTHPEAGTGWYIVLRIGSNKEFAFHVAFERSEQGTCAHVELLEGKPAGFDAGHDNGAWATAIQGARRAPPGTAARQWQEALQLAEVDGRVGPRFTTLRDWALARFELGEHEAAFALLARAQEIADVPEHDIYSRTRLAAWMEDFYLALGQPERAFEVMEECIERQLAAGGRAGLSFARRALALCYWRAGRDDDALDQIDLITHLDLELHASLTTLSAEAELARATLLPHGSPESREAMLLAERIAESVGARSERPWWNRFEDRLAGSLREHGDADRALQICDRSLADTTERWPRIYGLTFRARILLDLARAREAAAALAEARALLSPAERMPPSTSARLDVIEARIHEARGELSEARRLYRRGLALRRDDEAEARLRALG